MLSVLFSLPVRNWIRKVGDLYQTGQTGGGMRVCDGCSPHTHVLIEHEGTHAVPV